MKHIILKQYDWLKKCVNDFKHQSLNDLWKSFKKCAKSATGIINWFALIAGFWGYTVRDIDAELAWWQCLLLTLSVMLALAVIFFIIFFCSRHKCYQTEINGKMVTIKTGNIFNEEGWKLIPFNERFDTDVDDKIIAHGTLNGKMIDSLPDVADLKKTIENGKNEKSQFMPIELGGKMRYPLGRIIVYRDFLMLAFTHFDEQEIAYIRVDEYEQLLFRMWTELRRVYMGKHINIPLLGTGVTDIKGMEVKNYTELLKCILCTLRRSNFQPVEGISIVLTEEAMEKVDMNSIRELY